MKKIGLLTLILTISIGVLQFLSIPSPLDRPLPTEVAPSKEESASFKQQREAFFAQMHRAAPSVNWAQMDQQTRKAKALDRMARMQRSAFKKGPNPDFVRDTVANGQIITHWREIGSNNQSGRILMATYDPATNLLYLASDGGNIWVGQRSANPQWQVQNDLYQIEDIHAMELMPTLTGQRLVIATRDFAADPVRYSEDGGQTWQISQGLANITNWGRSIRMVRSPDASQTLYVLAQEWDYNVWEQVTTVYRSLDQGLSFTQLTSFSSALYGGAGNFDLWTDPQNAGDVFLIHEDQVYRLQNGSFQAISTVPGNPDGDPHLRGAGATLYAAYRDGSSLTVYRSTDNGSIWTLQGTAPTGLFRKTSFEVAPHDPNRLFAGQINAYTSGDGGATWTLVNNWAEYYGQEATKLHADIPGFPSFRDPQGNPFTIVCTDGGAYISYNDLASVANISLEKLNVSQYYSTYTMPNTPSTIYVGSQDQGFQKGTVDEGGVMDFEQTISGDYGHLGSGNSGGSIWATYPGFTIHFPTAVFNNNREYEDFPTEGHLWLAPLASDPFDATVAYMGGGKVIPAGGSATGAHLQKVEYQAGNLTYTEMPYNFSPSGDPISAIALSETFQDSWYVMTAEPRFFFSTDGGANWSSSNHMDLPENHYFYGNSILPSPNVDGRVYIGGSGYSNPAVYYSLDHGVTVQAMVNGLPSTLVYDLACTPDESMIFAATEVGPYVFTASDSTWHAMEGMSAPDQTYWSVEYVPGLHAARFGTYGRGIWDFVICDSLSPLAGEFAYSVSGAEALTVSFNNKSQGAYFYEWDLGNGFTLNQKSPNHTFPGSGTYEVKLMASNHCFVDTIVQQIALIQTDLETELRLGMSVFPNPSQGELFLQNDQIDRAGVKIVMMATNGQIVFEKTIDRLEKGGSLSIAPPQLGAGIYLIQVMDQSGNILLNQKQMIR